jgi:acyl carrier protein
MTDLADIRDRVRAVLASVLGIDAAKVPDDASASSLEGWDSLRHINVILALEDEFGAEFSADEVGQLTSLPLLAAAIAARRAGTKA